MIFVVLGMHKSGTTLVSQILHHSGINMGDDIDASIAYDRGNQYERTSALDLNREILGCGSTLSIDITIPKRLELTSDQSNRMQGIICQCSQLYLDWGFKDPRTCLTYPLWAEELPEHKIIAVYRPVDELWRRYRPKTITRTYQELSVAYKLLRRWCESNLGVLNAVEHTSLPAVALKFSDLMSRPEDFERLQQFVDRPLEDRRRKELYRSRATKSLALDFARWIVKRQTGMDPDEILARLENLYREPAYA